MNCALLARHPGTVRPTGNLLMADIRRRDTFLTPIPQFLNRLSTVNTAKQPYKPGGISMFRRKESISRC